MFDRREVSVLQEHHKDLLHAAERQRLIRQIESPGGEIREHFTHRALTWLRRHLVVWGCLLETRYSTSVEASAAPAADCCR
jgi:hypothetical protein